MTLAETLQFVSPKIRPTERRRRRSITSPVNTTTTHIDFAGDGGTGIRKETGQLNQSTVPQRPSSPCSGNKIPSIVGSCGKGSSRKFYDIINGYSVQK